MFLACVALEIFTKKAKIKNCKVKITSRKGTKESGMQVHLQQLQQTEMRIVKNKSFLNVLKPNSSKKIMANANITLNAKTNNINSNKSGSSVLPQIKNTNYGSSSYVPLIPCLPSNVNESDRLYSFKNNNTNTNNQKSNLNYAIEKKASSKLLSKNSQYSLNLYSPAKQKLPSFNGYNDSNYFNIDLKQDNLNNNNNKIKDFKRNETSKAKSKPSNSNLVDNSNNSNNVINILKSVNDKLVIKNAATNSRALVIKSKKKDLGITPIVTTNTNNSIRKYNSNNNCYSNIR